MNIVSFNLNGIRSARRKGLSSWIQTHDPDIICVQETKAQIASLSKDDYFQDNYFCDFSCAEKKGYSGVGIYAKKEPLNITYTCGLPWADAEGRYIAFEYENFISFIVILQL